MENKCKECKFWKEQPDDHETGQCRRYPPQFIVAVLNKEYEAPQNNSVPMYTPFDYWCGEFAPYGS